jgi:hypothetical protein
MRKKNVGSSFDDWLREEGIYEETAAFAIKRVLARQNQPGDGSASADRKPNDERG